MEALQLPDDKGRRRGGENPAGGARGVGGGGSRICPPRCHNEADIVNVHGPVFSRVESEGEPG